ncbi:pentatricopeptide repeat-containing protein [Tanacetum coccineum]
MLSSKIPMKLNPYVVSNIISDFHDCEKMFRLAVFLCNIDLYGCASVITDHVIDSSMLYRAFGDCYEVCYEECVLNLNPKVFEFVVDRCRVKGSLDICVGLMTIYEEFVCDTSSLCFNSLLRDLIKCGNLELFWDVCGLMLVTRRLFDVYMYTNMIKAHCMDGDVDAAKRVLVEMSGKRLEDARLVLKEMFDAGVEPNVVTYNALVNGFILEGDLERAVKVKDEMIASPVGADLVVYNTLLYGLCKEHMMDKAGELTSEMIKLGVNPDLKTFHMLIHGYCRVSRMIDAFLAVDEMKKLGFEPDVRTYCLLIIGLCHARDLEKAYLLLSETSLKEFKLDQLVYETLLSACSKQSDYTKSKKVFELMKEQGMMLNEFCYGSIIGCLCRVEKLDEARSFMNEMIENGLEPNTHIFGSLIYGYCKLRDSKVANKYFYTMLGRELVPTGETYTILAEENCRSGNYVDAFSIFRCMLSRKVFSDIRTYKVLIDCLMKYGYLEDVSRLLIELHSKGIVYNHPSVSSLVLSLCKKQKVEEAYSSKELFEEIKQKGLSPDHVTYGTMIIGFCKSKDCCHKTGDSDKAKDLCQKMTEKGYILIRLLNALGQNGLEKGLISTWKSLGTEGDQLIHVITQVIVAAFQDETVEASFLWETDVTLSDFVCKRAQDCSSYASFIVQAANIPDIELVLYPLQDKLTFGDKTLDLSAFKLSRLLFSLLSSGSSSCWRSYGAQCVYCHDSLNPSPSSLAQASFTEYRLTEC